MESQGAVGMQGLKGCPFCGRETAEVMIFHTEDADLGAVICTFCHARGPTVRLGDIFMADNDEARAMGLWNDRRE